MADSPSSATVEFRVQRQHANQWHDVGTMHQDLSYTQTEHRAWEKHKPSESFRVVQREVGPWVELTPNAPTPPCEWCGRAIYRGTYLGEPVWLAVKGEERGYDPLTCEASDDVRHDPGAAS